MSVEIRLEAITHHYGEADSGVEALHEVELQIAAGEFAALMGPSGCGKTTLLNLIGGMDRPARGGILVDGEDITRYSDEALTEYRRDRIGFIFQFFNLLPTLSIIENVEMPLLLAGKHGSEVRLRAGQLLEQVGLGDRVDDYPHQFSGGQMQRVAIARALVHEPRIILADEPTGNLDTANGQTILGLLQSLSQRHGTTVLMATHNTEAAGVAGRTIEMRDGSVVSSS
ncbi:MAG: ABC transporter ATP-binding protein [Planctomycetota bacterium]|nr:ABC transporter ATP-binding protein [Planctomycetota bacterium]MDP7252468.1 ABC transporter ATP-binding protein [Planctomycetota bacterium]